MMLADNGSAWYLSGAPDSRWNNDDLHNLGLLHGSDFEAVDVSGLMVDPNSGQAKQSNTVTVTVTPASATVPVNGTQQFTAAVTNATTQLVNWSVNAAAGGNSTAGWVSTRGLYTAPAVPPSGAVTVQAASAVSPSAVGSATVTVVNPTPLLAKPTLASITPSAGKRGTSVNVTLVGTNFATPLTVVIHGASIAVSNVAVVNSTTITATFRISSSAVRNSRSVTVTTRAGSSNALAFTVQ
jgi:hypothetical protein